MATINVYVIDDSSFDLTMAIDGALTWSDIRVLNVADTVNKLNKLKKLTSSA